MGPRDGISALILHEEAPESFLALCPLSEDTVRRRPSASQEESTHQETALAAPDVALPVPRTVSNEFLSLTLLSGMLLARTD